MVQGLAHLPSLPFASRPSHEVRRRFFGHVGFNFHTVDMVTLGDCTLELVRRRTQDARAIVCLWCYLRFSSELRPVNHFGSLSHHLPRYTQTECIQLGAKVNLRIQRWQSTQAL